MTLPPLPSLDRARNEIEWNEEIGTTLAANPTQAYVGAAIVLQVDGIRREQWDDEVDMSERLFRAFPRGMIPAPRIDLEMSYKIIPDDAVAKRATCTECSITHGRVFCPMCGGTGARTMDQTIDPCFNCSSSGMVTCGACEGTGVALTTKVRYVSDRPIQLRRTFVPTLGKFRSRIESLIDASARWDERFGFEPQPQVVASAYRGAAAVREPDFHGFFFGDALPLALQAVADLSVDRGIAAQQSRCFAAPVLWLVYPNVHVVLVTRPDGSLKEFTEAVE
jgi:hypothetical protein